MSVQAENPTVQTAEQQDWFLAAALGDLGQIRTLLRRNNALIALRDNEHGTAEELAERYKHSDVAAFLRSRKNHAPVKQQVSSTDFSSDPELDEALAQQQAYLSSLKPSDDGLRLAGSSSSSSSVEEVKSISNHSADDIDALLSAAESGDLDRVKQLLKNGVAVDAAHEDGITALMVAVLRGHYRIVDFLVLKGADTLLSDRNGYTVLDYNNHTRDAVIRMLITKYDGAIFLDAARRGDAEALQLLLAQGRVQATDGVARQALELVVASQDQRCSELLQASGVYLPEQGDYVAASDPDSARTESQEGSLHMEIESRSDFKLSKENVAEFSTLLESRDEHAIARLLEGIVAPMSGDEQENARKVFAALLEAHNANEEAASRDVAGSREESVDSQNSASQGSGSFHDVDIRDIDDSDLGAVIRSRRFPSMDEAKTEYNPTFNEEQIIEFFARVQRGDPQQVLSFVEGVAAAVNGNMQSVLMSLLNARNVAGKTPLQLAIEGSDKNMMQWLLMQGANPYVEDGSERNAFSYSERCGDSSISAFLSRYVDFFQVVETGSVRALNEFFSSCPPDVWRQLINARAPGDPDGKTALMLVINNQEECQSDKVDKVKCLLAHGADLYLANRFGNDARRYASGNREIGLVLEAHIAAQLSRHSFWQHHAAKSVVTGGALVALGTLIGLGLAGSDASWSAMLTDKVADGIPKDINVAVAFAIVFVLCMICAAIYDAKRAVSEEAPMAGYAAN